MYWIRIKDQSLSLSLSHTHSLFPSLFILWYICVCGHLTSISPTSLLNLEYLCWLSVSNDYLWLRERGSIELLIIQVPKVFYTRSKCVGLKTLATLVQYWLGCKNYKSPNFSTSNFSQKGVNLFILTIKIPDFYVHHFYW